MTQKEIGKKYNDNNFAVLWITIKYSKNNFINNIKK